MDHPRGVDDLRTPLPSCSTAGASHTMPDAKVAGPAAAAAAARITAASKGSRTRRHLSGGGGPSYYRLATARWITPSLGQGGPSWSTYTRRRWITPGEWGDLRTPSPAAVIAGDGPGGRAKPGRCGRRSETEPRPLGLGHQVHVLRVTLHVGLHEGAAGQHGQSSRRARHRGRMRTASSRVPAPRARGRSRRG